MEAEIVTSSKPAVDGSNFTLTCKAKTLETKPTLTNPLLDRYLTIEWVDRNGEPITEREFVTIGVVSPTFSRTIHFDSLDERDGRLYRCVVTLDLPVAVSTSTAEHRIILGES